MLSRVANSIYWTNRYLERAENNARFMDVNFNLTLDLPQYVFEQWEPLVVATGNIELFKSLYSKATRENVIHFMGFDKGNPSSIFCCLSKARENARIIRENITREIWEQINELYFLVKRGERKEKSILKDPRKFFDEVKKRCQLLNGIAQATVARTDGWHFGRIGQYLERGDNTSRILDVKYHIILPSVTSVGSPIDLIHWAALLKSVSAYTTYRRSYGKIVPANIAEYLMLNKKFPRSILHCLIQAEHSLHQISGGDHYGFKNHAEKKIGSVRSHLEYTEINDIFSTGLHEYLDDIQVKIISISEALFDVYFSRKI